MAQGKKWIVGALLLLWGGSVAHAATLYLSPATGTLKTGDTFAVDVRLDPEGECVNTADVAVSFPNNLVQAVDFAAGDSILNLWALTPTIKNEFGTVTFIGGIPGGYCGRVPGDPGLSNNLGKIIFKVATSTVGTTAPIPVRIGFLNSTEVLLNNGFGTEAALKTKEAQFAITDHSAPGTVYDWQGELKDDKTPPEPFTVGVYSDPSIFNGDFFATFSTIDKQTGMDHYEVMEAKNGAGSWVPAVSPYRLQDQNLASTISVKAVDKAGNERIETYIPQTSSSGTLKYWLLLVGLAGLAFTVIRWVAALL